MVFGYGRVSTRDQNLNLQEDALLGAGCDQIFMEKVSGTKKVRPELDKLRAQLRAGDTLVIWRLDRLGRSLVDLVNLMNEFRAKQVRFRCLTMDIDTGTASGRLLYNIFAALAEYVHDLIVENTQAGLAASRARGVQPGRKKGMSEQAKIKAVSAATLYSAGNQSTRAIAAQLNISTRTLYKYLQYQGILPDQPLPAKRKPLVIQGLNASGEIIEATILAGVLPREDPILSMANNLEKHDLQPTLIP